MDVSNPEISAKLWASVSTSRRKLEVFRRNRAACLKEYVGYHYSEDGAADKVPVNLLQLMVNIYSRLLVPSSPALLVTTPHAHLKPIAANLQLACKRLLQDIDFESTSRTAVMDALFSIGIIKVGINNSGSVELGGVTHDVGQPFADYVSLDDWVHDVTARRVEDFSFCGNRYRIPKEDAMDSGLFDTSVLERANSSEHTVLNETGDDRASRISQGGPVFDEFREMIELWDIWVPGAGESGQIVTFVSDAELPPCRIVDWQGPERGPYHLLRLFDVPDNVMPLAPVLQFIDLHDSVNRLYRKLIRQAERQKTIMAYSGTKEDADRIQNANDGEGWHIDQPDKVQQLKFGGPEEINLLFASSLKDLYTWGTGNLDALGGLSPQASTLGQDKLLMEQASQMIQEMQRRTSSFIRGVMRDLTWWLWEDPLIAIPLTKRVGTVEIPTVFSSSAKEGDFLDYNFDIDPYSMQVHTPAMRMNTIKEIMSTIVAPFASNLEQQNLAIDMRALLKILGSYANAPELSEIIVSMEAPLTPDTDIVHDAKPRKSPVSIRNYVRTNRSFAPTRRGSDVMLQQGLMGIINKKRENSNA